MDELDEPSENEFASFCRLVEYDMQKLLHPHLLLYNPNDKHWLECLMLKVVAHQVTVRHTTNVVVLLNFRHDHLAIWPGTEVMTVDLPKPKTYTYADPDSFKIEKIAEYINSVYEHGPVAQR